MKRSLALIILLLSLPSVANGASGLIFRDTCSAIASPEVGTLCMQNVSPFALSVWDGAAWTPIASPNFGSVLSFSAGDLSPLFTSSVATPTTTPALTFTLIPQDNNTMYANMGGVTAPPSFIPILGMFDSILGSTVGAVAYRGGAGWGSLTPGTFGQVLMTEGIGAAPSWQFPAPTGNFSGTFLVSGGSVTWLTGYTFRIQPATYYIDGVFTTSAQQDITLSAADPTVDRIDAITLNAAGTAGSTTGTPGSPPFEPVVDPMTLLRLTSVYVTAGSTTPGVTTTMIYDEGTEWGATASAGTIVVGSTNFPNTGTLSIEGTNAVLNDEVVFVKPSGTIALNSQDVLVFYVRVKAAWSTNKRIRTLWRSGATQVGQFIDVRNGEFGFNSQLVGAYQQIVVPVSLYAAPVDADAVDTFVMRIVGGGAAVGFYWDTIQVQAGFFASPSTVPAGANGAVQFNDGGILGGFGFYNKNILRLTLPGELVVTGRTGTPATFATFNSNGKLVEGAAYTGAPGGGTVTSFSAGDLSPLFTSSVATATTTPALTFSLSTAADKTILSNISGGAATPSYNTIANVLDSQLGSTRGMVAIRGVSSWAGTPPGTSGHVLTSQGAGSDPTWAAVTVPTVQTRRVCAMVVGADNGTALVAADLGPQKRQCFIPASATVVEVNVSADAGTPDVITARNRAGSVANLTSATLATAASGGIACSNTGGTTGLDGATTCSSTLQNTSLNAGDYLELVSGAASTAKRMSIFVIYTVN